MMKTPTPDEVREAFRVLSASKTFVGSDRLIGFLDYVVTEKLEGRENLIRGKSIALDVYGYDPDEIERRESVVRVDAGRVRRKLEEYYSSEGAAETVRIDLPKGGYAPVFGMASRASLEQRTDTPPPSGLSASSKLVAAATFMIAMSLVVWSFNQVPSPDNGQATLDNDDVQSTENAKRAVLFDSSPKRLQAVNLANHGRDIVFPATDRKRLEAALLVFESVISLDGTYAGGYAGASQVLGLMALTSADKEKAAALTDQSRGMAEQALALSPDLPWAVSAKAWSFFSAGSYDSALEWSDKAKKLGMDDPHILEFDTLISLYSGEFERVLNDTAGLVEDQNSVLPFVFQNARSAAFFHLGSYEKTVAGFEAAIASGAPLGPMTVAYLMAAHQRLGQTKRATEMADKYADTWPELRVDLMTQRWFQDPRHSAQLTDAMRASGWQPR